jgi:hypothetical protein
MQTQFGPGTCGAGSGFAIAVARRVASRVRVVNSFIVSCMIFVC